MTIDIDKLRNDLINYYGTAMASGHLMATVNLARVETASAEEVARMALECGMNLRDYEV